MQLQNSKQKIGLFLKKNFHSLNQLIQNPTEFQWLGLPFSDNQPEKSDRTPKFEASFNDNLNIEYNFDNKEYVWYKNINIPKIKVSQVSFYPIDQLRAEIMVFGGILSGDFSHVDIKGKNSFNFHLRECTVKGIRVGETSHTLKGKQLHLVVCISSQSNPSNIHYVLVSSGILIFGRKKKFSQRIDNALLIEPFIPYYLKEQRDLCDETEGLVNYLTSKKIRHKILHPLYLFLQFPRVFELFYNKSILKSYNKITYCIQNLLMKTQLKKNKEDFLIARIIITDERNQKEYTQKIQKSLNQLHLRIVTSKEKIPQNFEKLQYEEDLIEEYFQNYKDISNIKMKYMKKLMQHPQKLVNIFQEGYDENFTESTSSQQSNKSMIKEPFNTNILSLNFQENCNQSNLLRIQALKN
ncbi:hypothetical protein ABPG74_018365 [Tetrahymena malaccensis]